ncbi:Flagellar hook-length control protein FliK [Stenotrophomonas maltophilia]
MAINDRDELNPAGVAPGQRRIAPRPSPGTAFGSALRSGVAGTATLARQAAGAGLRAAGTVADAVTAPGREAAGFVRDAGRAAAGAAPSPRQGQPLRAPSELNPIGGAASALSRLAPVRLGGAAKPKPTFAGVSSSVDSTAGLAGSRLAGRPAIGADFTGISSSVNSTAPAAGAAGAAAPRAAAAPVAAAPSTYTTQDGRTATLPAGITRTVDAKGNSVFTGSAATIAASGAATAPAGGSPASMASPVAAAASAPTVVAPRPTPQVAQRGRQGGIIENPADTTVDKLTRAMGSASLKGSPSGRAAVAQAILGEAGARQAERASALRTQDEADLAAGQVNAVAAQGDANRALQAGQFNAQMQDNAANRQASLETARIARRPEISVAADGSMGVVGSDGGWRPVTGADGQSVRAAQPPRQTGELTDADRLKSYTDRFNAISGNVTMDEAAKTAALAQLDADPLYAGLRPQEAPPVAGARKAPDGNWYVQNNDGSYSKVNL